MPKVKDQKFIVLKNVQTVIVAAKKSPLSDVASE